MAIRSIGLTAAALAVVLFSLPSPAAAADKVRVGLSSIYPAYSVVYAATDLGYYRDKDLDVEITLFRGGPATQEALAAGAIDVSTIAPAAAALAIAKGVREQIVALSVPSTPAGWFIEVPVASPIKTPAELNGKTVGITQKGSLTDFLAQEAARANGIIVQTIPVGFPGLLSSLKAKQVDASVLSPILSYRAIVDGDGRTIIDLSKTIEPSVHEGWAVTGDLIQNHAKVLRRWLSANARALIYMQTHEEWAVALLKRYLEESDERVVKIAFDDFITKIPPDGVMQLEWKKASLAIASGLNRTLPPIDEVFSTAFTPIKPE